MGVGTVIIILETLESAETRKSKVYAEISGIFEENSFVNLSRLKPYLNNIDDLMDSIRRSNSFNTDDIDFVSDSGNSSKKQLTASNLNVSNPTLPYATLSSSMFNDTCGSSCDYVALFSPDGSIADQFQYTSEMIEQEGKTIGRSPDGSDAFTVLSSQTKGSQNSIPQPSPTPTPQSTTSQSSSPTSGKSKSLSPTPKNSSSPASSKKTTSVLGSSKSAEITRSPVSEISLSVSPTPSAEPKAEQSSNKLKIAGTVAGSGAIVMGLSAGLYLWYRRRITKNNSDKESI